MVFTLTYSLALLSANDTGMVFLLAKQLIGKHWKMTKESTAKTSELQIGIIFWAPIALSGFLYVCFHSYGFSGLDIIKSALCMWCFSWFVALRWHFKNNISQIKLIVFDAISCLFVSLELQQATNWLIWYWVTCICLLINVLRFICRSQPENDHQ